MTNETNNIPQGQQDADNRLEMDITSVKICRSDTTQKPFICAVLPMTASSWKNISAVFPALNITPK